MAVSRTNTTPYQRIMRAASRATGCRLSAGDCARLARDHAISHRASMDDADHCECWWHTDLWHDRAGEQCPSCGEAAEDAAAARVTEAKVRARVVAWAAAVVEAAEGMVVDEKHESGLLGREGDRGDERF